MPTRTPPTTDPTRPGPSAFSRRWPGRALVAAGLLAAGLGVTACGSSSSNSASAPTILNTEKVERAIEHSNLTQRQTPTQVSCPSGVHQKKGLTFDCTAVAAHGSTRFVVTQSDGAGHVHYEGR